VATGDVCLLATLVEVDPATGRATSVERVRVTQAEAESLYRSVAPAKRDVV
jgi:hypothetical protein